MTPAERERLTMLVEEAGEVVQACCKALRNGYESRHPDGGPTNREGIRAEVTDLFAVMNMMFNADDLPYLAHNEIVAAQKRKLRYSHHQERNDQ